MSSSLSGMLKTRPGVHEWPQTGFYCPSSHPSIHHSSDTYTHTHEYKHTPTSKEIEKNLLSLGNIMEDERLMIGEGSATMWLFHGGQGAGDTVGLKGTNRCLGELSGLDRRYHKYLLFVSGPWRQAMTCVEDFLP